MTREEAIAYGKRVIDLGLNDKTQAFCELAIKALEQEPCEDFKQKAGVVIEQLRADRDRLEKALDEIRVETKAMFPPSGSWMYDEDPGRCNVVCEVLTDVLQIIDKHRRVEE